jgi:hypothetical protein
MLVHPQPLVDEPVRRGRQRGARASGDRTGVVTDGVNPVAGAFVAATGAEGQATAVTDADGHYSVDQLPEGDYTVAVQASGFTVGTEAVAVAGNAAVDASFALRSSGATFSSLPFYGGQIEHLFSGGVPGLFYAATGAIPQIFRTVDYGGHWTPVSTQYDDPANGLDKWTLQPGNRVAVSGHPGEIALRMNASVYYSRDFGATWQALPEQFPLNGSGPHEVFWGHAGDSSVLLVRDGTQSWRADMTQASPHLVRMTAGYGASTDVVTVADGVGAPWVAALSTSGTLTIYRLTADEPATPEGSPLTGFPNGSKLLVLSGTSTAQTPPSAVFTHGSGGDVVIALKDAEDSVFTAARRSAPYPMPSECAAGTGSFIAPASLAPTSGGARAFGTMGFCAVQDEAGTLTARQMWGGANNIAYDAGYGADGDLVILANGNRGIAKSASVDGHGVPIFPSDQDAAAGAGPNSGGDSVDGINVPVVADTAYGPSADNIATVLAAGGLGYASDDGGRTSHIAVRSGGSAVAWWQGATHSWLMFGTGGQGTLLTAIPDWSASSPTLDQPNLVDVQASDLGFPDPDRNGLSITALAGIPDSDTVFVGVGKGGDWSPEEEATSGALARVTLTAVPRPSASVVTPLGGTAFDHAAVRGSHTARRPRRERRTPCSWVWTSARQVEWSRSLRHPATRRRLASRSARNTPCASWRSTALPAPYGRPPAIGRRAAAMAAARCCARRTWGRASRRCRSPSPTWTAGPSCISRLWRSTRPTHPSCCCRRTWRATCCAPPIRGRVGPR